MNTVKNYFRKFFFPGFDIHTRSRAMMCKYWDMNGKVVLDAGCGNGYFVSLAHKMGGKKCIGISFDDENTKKAKILFRKKVDKDVMSFKTINIYQLDDFFEPASIDVIICYETIEHLMDDNAAIRCFYRLLKPGGVLHLCAPNKDHFEHANITPSVTEDGWHVRKGYDKNDFTVILENAGFHVSQFAGVGNNITYRTDRIVRNIRNNYGHIWALPFFLVANIISKIYGYESSLEKAYSVYAKAVK